LRKLDTGAFFCSKWNVIRIEEGMVSARKQMISNYHPAGSCMVAPIEKRGVVNERLRVHGVKDPKVVNAIVFQVIPGRTIIMSVYSTTESRMI
jgi:choline dehydrogenase-like flavoprotein